MRIAVIGCGVMGSAFARHFALANELILCDYDRKRCEQLASELGGVAEESIAKAVQEAETILLAVKPKDIDAVVKAMQGGAGQGKILISILAGTPLAVLQSHFPAAFVVRCMPNLSLVCGEGVLGLVEDERLSQKVIQTVNTLFEGMGLIAWLPESKIEALTALTASGLGFLFVILDALIDGGVLLGIPAHEAREFVLKLFEGSVAMMRKTGKHPAELKLMVASPAGTTIEGIKAMEEKGIRAAILAGLEAAYKKGMPQPKRS